MGAGDGAGVPQEVRSMIRLNAPGSDGVASLSTVWAVMEAARAGAADATAAARGFLPAAGALLSGGIHATGFAVGYLTTFPAVMLARVVPGNNAVVYGLADGGRAGIDLARSTLQGASLSGSSAAVPKLAAVEA
jgi:hypothetical protein